VTFRPSCICARVRLKRESRSLSLWSLWALVIAGSLLPGVGPEKGSSVEYRTVAASVDGGCTLRDVPGDLNQNCIRVDFTGNFVEQIYGYIQSGKAPMLPQTVCDITVEMWGQPMSGPPFRVSHQGAGCSEISRGVYYKVQKALVPGSSVCSRSLWQNSWSSPACIEVRHP
jgi:hypothetical protein